MPKDKKSLFYYDTATRQLYSNIVQNEQYWMGLYEQLNAFLFLSSNCLDCCYRSNGNSVSCMRRTDEKKWQKLELEQQGELNKDVKENHTHSLSLILSIHTYYKIYAKFQFYTIDKSLVLSLNISGLSAKK